MDEPEAREPALPEPTLPFTLGGRYEATALLAEGGSARVYVGRDLADDTPRALKVLRPELVSEPELRRRLEAEAETMQSLQHPHVLPVHAAGRDGELVWFAMDLARRGTVDDLVVARGPLPAVVVVDVALQVCAALAHAHAHGVVHRDVNPRNVLIDDTGTCRVADFGIAKVLHHRITATGYGIGTLGYIAPEQLDSAKHVDGRADIYGLGATLFRIATGQPPRDLFVLEPGDPPLSELPDGLARIVLRCARHRASDRYPDVEAVSAALRDLRAELPPLDGPDPLRTPAPPPVPEALRRASVVPRA